MKVGISVLCAVLAACGEPGGDDHPLEVITTSTMTFTPAGGAAVVAVFDDPDGDGGAAPTIDPVNLVAGTTYTLTITFENRLETPPEDITAEVRDEGDAHQVFVTGTAVRGPATSNTTGPLTHTYGDTDANGLPIGLTNTIVAAAGTGQLTVTLRHMPPVNDTAVKTATTNDTVKTSGFTATSGSTDFTGTFDVTVP